ncbi:alpha/beta fold hydrolase [Actinoplanes utahensis]|uniref:Hydrolase n=1 Tax=Actinoplanes utahensis TaxID=1869 RepID=A0A0A6UK46_ACTUT|nr:alpha/beta hydrolase [Actinoplanes utahensis]KHD75781.1 hydrolase [Actinoplanes utahensis]
MHVVHDGPAGAPPLLLVHGTGATGGTWAPLVAGLATGHHVIRVDLPGCGRSPAAVTYDVPAQAGRVAAVLDELGLRDVAVAGHSSGGYVATALAEHRPDLVASLTLISTGPALDALFPQPVVLRVLLRPPFGPLLWRWRTDTVTRRALAATAAGPVDLPDEVVADLRGQDYRTFRAIEAGYTAYLAERSIPERLGALGVPLLVLFGDADPRWDPASAQRYRTVPGARIEMLAGVGHLPMFEAPGKLLAGLCAA